mmetsp:Transcript_88598/g.235788  ORF Transcript_88598/g.235788 Transcript_88598/m.235788 type:complete len:780 (+) Transcript_88598:387-2726(+)
MRIFVKAQAIHQTSAHERLIETLRDRIQLDYEYILFASQRGSGQPDASGSTSKDEVNAYQMLEFELKFDKVQKLHHDCILALKKFWQMLYKHKKIFRTKKKYSEHLSEKVEELLLCMEIIEASKNAAYEGYRTLLEKFPRSISLLRSFAGFCDDVLNRSAEAAQYRDQALMLESNGDSEPSIASNQDDEDRNFADDLEAAVAAKSTSSSEGTTRAKMDRFFASWRESVMGRELRKLKTLHWRIFNATLLIILVCTVGFVLTDSMLYEQWAHASINLVVGAQIFRVDLMDALYSIRSLFLAGTLDPKSVPGYGARLDAIAQRFASEHLKNFQDAPAAVVGYYNAMKWQAVFPFGSLWTQTRMSLWTLGNEFASQIGLASGIKGADFKNWTNQLEGSSPGLRAAAYIYENTVQYVLPAYEGLDQAYIDQVLSFGSLTQTMVMVNVSVNVVLILLVAAHVLRSLDGMVYVVQHQRVVMLMVLYCTRASTKKIFSFYEEADKALTELEEGGLMSVDPTEEPDRASPRGQGDDDRHGHTSVDDDSRRPTSAAWEDDDGLGSRAGEGDRIDPASDSDGTDVDGPNNDDDCDDGGEAIHSPREASRTELGENPQRSQRLRRSSSPEARAPRGRGSPERSERHLIDIQGHRGEARATGGTSSTSLEASSHEAVVRAQALARMRSAPKTMMSLEVLVTQRRPWYAQRPVHVVTLAIILSLCIVSVVIPSRNISAMVNIPAKRNQAGRRRFLHRACVHFARELVLGDGLSRLNSAELAAALRWSLEELK